MVTAAAHGVLRVSCCPLRERQTFGKLSVLASPALPSNSNTVGKLPTYRGYIVDYRLRQFRSQPEIPGVIEFINFTSLKGVELLAEMNREPAD